MGEQWEESTLKTLKQAKRPALTINRIKPVIRTLSGYQRQNRRDLKVLPRRGGVDAVAQINTALLKHVSDESNYDQVASQCFLDGLIGGRGFMSADVDYMKDPISGQLMIKREDPFLVREDPFNTEYSLNGGRFVFRLRWLDKDQVDSMYPKAKETEGFWDGIDGLTGADGISEETDDYFCDERQKINDIGKFRYLVKECWYKEYKSKKIVVDRVAGWMEDYNSFGEDEDERAYNVGLMKLQSDSISVETRTVPELNVMTLIGNKELDQITDPYNGMTLFPIERFSPEIMYAEKQMCRGEIQDIISAQDELNKRRSQALHLINTSANSGYIVEKGALNATQLQRLQTMGSQAGVVIQTEQGGLNKLKRIEPSQLSTGHVELSQLADGDIKAISGVNADLLGGGDTNATSGVAMEMRRRQGLINVEPVFDNNDTTHKNMGNVVLQMINNTDVYTPDEVAYLIGNQVKTVDGQQVGPEEVKEFMQTKQGQYSVVMSQQDSNPTQRRANFKDMLDAIGQLQLPVPPEMILEASDFSFKDELLAKMAQQQQAMPNPAQGGTQQGDPVQQQAVADMLAAGGQPV